MKDADLIQWSSPGLRQASAIEEEKQSQFTAEPMMGQSGLAQSIEGLEAVRLAGVAMTPICCRTFNAQELVDNYPPRLHHRNKRIVFHLSSPPGAIHSGTIAFSRWRRIPLPRTLKRGVRPAFELRDDYFTYDASPDGQVDWHVNFAHSDLFCAYGGPLFAQDEMQVAEHPALASLRDALIAVGIKPQTVEHGVPTPALVMGVERRCTVATDVNPAEARPYGLYGNHFSRASEMAVRRATRVLDPPTISNIIAMEAPDYGAGRYTREQLEYIFSTAITGFRAAARQSRESIGPAARTTVHTGYWGCGAYGGNRELMPLLQMVAACAAGIDTLVFHSGADSAGYEGGREAFEELLPKGRDVNTHDLLSRIEAMNYEWGVSDGN